MDMKLATIHAINTLIRGSDHSGHMGWDTQTDEYDYDYSRSIDSGTNQCESTTKHESQHTIEDTGHCPSHVGCSNIHPQNLTIWSFTSIGPLWHVAHTTAMA